MRRGRISYSADELNWIKACSDLPRAELHALFVQVFDRPDVTQDNLKGLCGRKGWHAGPEGRRRNLGKSLIFTEDQIAWLRANGTLTRYEVVEAFRIAFPGTDFTVGQIVAWRKRNGIRTGRTGRFPKGTIPPNKGRKGYVAPGSEKGWFQKGQRPHTAKEIGYETIDSNGYVKICVAENNPYTGASTFMAFKHRWLWEQANGPVPKGQVLKCIDGDKTNCDPSNWMLMSKAMLARLAGKSGRDYDRAPAEVKPVILAVAQLEQAVSDRRKRA